MKGSAGCANLSRVAVSPRHSPWDTQARASARSLRRLAPCRGQGARRGAHRIHAYVLENKGVGVAAADQDQVLDDRRGLAHHRGALALGALGEVVDVRETRDRVEPPLPPRALHAALLHAPHTLQVEEEEDLVLDLQGPPGVDVRCRGGGRPPRGGEEARSALHTHCAASLAGIVGTGLGRRAAWGAGGPLGARRGT